MGAILSGWRTQGGFQDYFAVTIQKHLIVKRKQRERQGADITPNIPTLEALDILM